jgi:DNA-directed RNA polymerase II subunit RPB2
MDWQIIDTFFRDTPHAFTQHHINSFHDFVFHRIPYTIKTLNPFTMLKNDDEGKLKHVVNIWVGGREGNQIYLSKPTVVEDGVQKNLFPNEARLKDLSYTSDLYADVLVEYVDHSQKGQVTEQLFQRQRLGSIPIMLHSKLCSLYELSDAVKKELGECPYDKGGYFIIDGKEKVIVAQERIATNRVFINAVEKNPDFSFEGLIRCTPRDNTLFPKTVRFAMYSDTYRQGERKRAIVLTCPNMTDVNIPICVMFRALGVESDRDILEHIVYDVNDPKNQSLIDMLRWSIIDGSIMYSQEEALRYLSHFVEYKSVDNVRLILMNDFLPNMGKSFAEKAMLLGHLVNQLVRTSLDMRKETDRDNYMFKRIDLSGFLMGNLFRDYYNDFRNNVMNQMDRQYLYGPWKTTGRVTQLINGNNIRSIFVDAHIEGGFRKSLKGAWGASGDPNRKGSKGDPSKLGIVQDLNRLSYLGTISHLRRVNTPLSDSAKVTGPHELSPTQWGYVCPIESPDGGNIGLLKHFSMMTHVTSEGSFEELETCVLDLGTIPIKQLRPHDVSHGTKVFINDIWVGMHQDAPGLVNTLRAYRRNALINIFTGVSWNVLEREVHVRTDAGRCTRPLHIVERDEDKGKAHRRIEHYEISNDMKWIDYLRGETLPLEEFNPYNMSYLSEKAGSLSDAALEKNAAIIEFVDVEETNNSLIAMWSRDLSDTSKRYTHCELHPSTVMSVYTNTIPMAHHNPGARNVFSGAQGKQAIGVYATNFPQRIDTMSYILHYPQQPLIHTHYSQLTNMDTLANGENLIVAICTYTGYNQEDSIMVNKNSIERGMFNITAYKAHVDQEKNNKYGGERIVFANPWELRKKGVDVDIKQAYWDKIDEHGFPKENQYIDEDDVYAGKCNIKTNVFENKQDGIAFGDLKVAESYSDMSSKGDKVTYGMVDKVVVFADEDKNRTMKVRFRKMRKPELGDKMASRHGQKGVCGMILPQENMPFTKDGLVPDIIINPHAFPSRMTLGHVIECVLSKLCCKAGVRIDGTLFDTVDTEACYDILEKEYGMNRHGDELLYNGFSGEQIATQIFIGPTYYFRLKHMVKDKINYRAAGPVNNMTHQPIKGRSRGGGLRIGEMETNVLLAHGIGSFIKESMTTRSDGTTFFVDPAEGLIATANEKQGLFQSVPGQSVTDIKRVNAPYAFRLVLNELEGFGISAKLQTEEPPAQDDDIDEYENITYQNELFEMEDD